MYQQSIIVRTKLVPPRPPQHTLPRERISRRLLAAQNHRLTIVQAGTGYGKSTALATLAHSPHEDLRFVWYRLEAEDGDAQPFLLHLLHGFGIAYPNLSDVPLAALETMAAIHQLATDLRAQGGFDPLAATITHPDAQALFQAKR